MKKHLKELINKRPLDEMNCNESSYSNQESIEELLYMVLELRPNLKSSCTLL